MTNYNIDHFVILALPGHTYLFSFTSWLALDQGLPWLHRG